MALGLPFGIAVVLAILVVLSAVLSALETALFSMKPFQIKGLEEHRPAFAKALSHVLENPRRALSGILFADALVNLPLMILCLFLLNEVLETNAPLWAVALGIFTVIVVLCDLAPKVVALAFPFKIAQTGLPLLRVIGPIVDPVARWLQLFSEQIAEAIMPMAFQRSRSLTEEELDTLVELSAQQGSLGAVESEMIHEILKLGDKTVRDCMTPRPDMFAIPDDLENGEAIAMVKARRFHRVPVYGETPDEIVGVLDVKRYLLNPSLPYTESLIPPSYVSETMKALDLLRSFLANPQGLAIIVDEFGGTEGIITLNDIVEQIISDAVPLPDHELYIEKVADAQWLVSAAARLDDLDEHLGIELEEDGIDTVGGLVFTHLGALPKPGDTLRIGDLTFAARRVGRNRIEEVIVTIDPLPVKEADDEK